MSNETFVEYRVVPVTRYQVTRFSKSLSPCRTGELVEGQGCCGSGEFDSADTAYEVAYALARADHERLGWPVHDDRIRYPQRECSPIGTGGVADSLATGHQREA